MKVTRRQVPLTTVKASTLQTIQGTTADPGLIFHWVFPRRLAMEMRWLAAYVALSRVRSLSRLRSIGLTSELLKMLQTGPPDSLPQKFQQLFADKEVDTNAAADAAMRWLGWA